MSNQQTVAVWGAGSGLGLAVAQHFSENGYQVIGISRNPSKSEETLACCQQVFACDATDKASVEATVAQLPKDAWIISTMGSFGADVPVDYTGHRYLIDALEANAIKRFLLVTSLGCGDSWQFLSERARQGFGFAVREKSLAEAWLVSSGLDFTILRPGGLINGPITGNGELTQGIEVHGVIHRSEVARLVAQLLNDDNSVGEIFQCVDPRVERSY
uniref:SDR family oxidoreductase n=1 Tax=Thaumasiovibrio occultus TaxID=1891184 RepID=UPI000B35D3DE|nr:SDR family oxidoreductase [Thaumasiovibrio occultus]